MRGGCLTIRELFDQLTLSVVILCTYLLMSVYSAIGISLSRRIPGGVRELLPLILGVLFVGRTHGVLGGPSLL